MASPSSPGSSSSPTFTLYICLCHHPFSSPAQGGLAPSYKHDTAVQPVPSCPPAPLQRQTPKAGGYQKRLDPTPKIIFLLAPMQEHSRGGSSFSKAWFHFFGAWHPKRGVSSWDGNQASLHQHRFTANSALKGHFCGWVCQSGLPAAPRCYLSVKGPECTFPQKKNHKPPLNHTTEEMVCWRCPGNDSTSKSFPQHRPEAF